MISYIVPIYNAEKYLSACIDSILRCMAAGDEIILIDDGSTDDSSGICERYSKENNCIVVKHLKNGGVSRARNIGLNLAKNEYVRFVDSDDEVIPVRVEPHSDLVIMDAEVVNGQKRLLRKVHLKERKVFRPKEILESISSSEKRCVLHYLWNHIYKRTIIVENLIRFEEDVTLGEDFLFNCAYLGCCEKIEYIPDICYRYYVRSNNADSLTRKFHPDELERRRRLDGMFLALFKKVGCSNRGLERAEQLIGEITIGSLESVVTKGEKKSAQFIRNYMSEFYYSEYYEFMMKYFASHPTKGKSETIEHILIRKKSCMLLYFYVHLRNSIRERSKR